MKNGIFNRQSILEVSLLALFAFGLFISNFIVDYKGRIKLGSGIPLAGSGLVVKLPHEDGWRGLKKWQYQRDNTLVLPASLMGRSDPVIEVSWKYILTPTTQNSREILSQITSAAIDQLPEIKSTTIGFPMDYVELLSPGYGWQQYIGAAVLDYGRVIVLQVSAKTDPSLTQNLFLTLAGSLEYKKPDELAGAIELLEKARVSHAAFFSDDLKMNYLIRDTFGNIRGCETTQIQLYPKRLQITRTTLPPAGVVWQRKQSYKSSGLFENFSWQSENHDRLKPLGNYSLNLKEDGDLVMENISGQIQTVKAGPAIVSELLLDWLIRYFLDGSQNKIAVDLLYFDGSIVPAQISSIPPAQAMGKAQAIAYAVRADLLNGWFVEFYFDARKKPLGKITQEIGRSVLVWETAQDGEIEKYFKIPAAPKGPVVQRMTDRETSLSDS